MSAVEDGTCLASASFPRSDSAAHRQLRAVHHLRAHRVCEASWNDAYVKGGRKFEMVAQNELDEAITAPPVISNGTLYLRTFEALWAIRLN